MSIYLDILNYLHENQTDCYELQDYSVCGKEEAKILFNKSSVSEVYEEECTKVFIELLGYYINGQAKEVLFEFLEDYPMIQYYFTLLRELNVLIREAILLPKEMAEIGYRLIEQGEDNNEIKVGITLLGLSQIEEYREVLETIALHSEFTFYVIMSMKNWDYYNSFIFNLAKKTKNIGKLHCMQNLKPINDEIKTYFVEEGFKTIENANIYASVCYLNIDFNWYIATKDIGEREYNFLVYYLYNLCSVEGNKITKFPVGTISYFVEVSKRYAKDIYSLLALSYIKSRTNPYWENGKADVEKENGWTSNIENDIRRRCIEILHNKKWEETLLSAIKDPAIKVQDYFQLSNDIGLKLNFNILEQVFYREKYNIDLYYYIDKDDDYGEDLPKLIDFIVNKFDLDAAFNGEEFTEDELTKENAIDICLLYVFKHINKFDYPLIELALKALKARFIDIRYEAIKHLKYNKELWDDDTISVIYEALASENDPKLIRSLKRLLSMDIEKNNKERKYVDVNKIEFEQKEEDIYLFTTKIAGVFYKDTTVIEDDTFEGDVVYLIAEPENPYDKNAILVTNVKGYVLGYIPRTMNKIPKRLLDGGKIMYGIIRSFDLEQNDINIDVYLFN